MFLAVSEKLLRNISDEGISCKKSNHNKIKIREINVMTSKNKKKGSKKYKYKLEDVDDPTKV